MTLQHAGADQCGDDVDEAHLEGRDPGEHCRAANLPGNSFARSGRCRREGVEVQRQLHVFNRVPQGLPDRVPHRLHVPRAGQFEAFDAHLGDAVDLLHGVVDVAIRKTGETDLAVGVIAAEILEEIVVDAQHLVRGFAVVEAGGRAEDSVDDLGVDAVTVHVLDPQMRVAATTDVPLAVLVHAGLGHLVDPMVLTRNKGRAARPDTVLQSEIGAVLGDPLRPLRPVLDIGHALLEVAPRFGHEQVGRHPRHVEMAIGRDPAVLHLVFPAQLIEGYCRALYSPSGRRDPAFLRMPHERNATRCLCSHAKNAIDRF